MKIITITCVVCDGPYEYSYKGGRKRMTCDKRECTNKRGNFTRAQSRKRASGEIPDYGVKLRPDSLTIENQNRIEEEYLAWREFKGNRRPQSGSSDIDLEGWESRADVDDDGHRVFRSDTEDEYEGVASDGSWVRRVNRATLSDGFVGDEERTDSNVIREMRGKSKREHEALDHWYQKTEGAPPKLAADTGYTVLDSSGRPTRVRGSVSQPEPIKGMSTATLLRNFGARPSRAKNAGGTELTVRPVPTLVPFVWQTGERFPLQLPPRFLPARIEEKAEREAQDMMTWLRAASVRQDPNGSTYISNEPDHYGVPYVEAAGTARALMPSVDTGALEDDRDWSRWTTTDTSTWWD